MELSLYVGAAEIPTTTTLAASPNPAMEGQTVTLTATVTTESGPAVGAVEFLEGATSLGTAAVADGIATLAVPNISAGSHTYTAVFTPDPPATGLSLLPAYHPSWTQVGNVNATTDGNDTRYILPDGDNQHVWVVKGYTNSTESAHIKRIDLSTGTASADIVLPLQIGKLNYTGIAPQLIVGDPDGQHVYVAEEAYISSRRVLKLHKYQYDEIAGTVTEVGVLDGTAANSASRIPAPTDWHHFTYDGKFYLSLMFDADGGSYDNATNFTAGAVIINLTDMQVVGYFPTEKAHFTKLAAGDTYWYCKSRSTFVDKNGDIWFVFFYNATSLGSTYWMYFFRWHPADGTSGTITWGNIANGPVLSTSAGLTRSLSGIFTGDTNTWQKTVGYEPSTHSALVGTYKTATGPVVRLSLSDLSTQAQHQDDGTFFYYDTVYTPAERCFFNGVHDGEIVFEGDTRGTIPTQYGGIFNFVDPVTLAVNSTVNVSSLLQSSGLTQPPQEWVSSGSKFVYPPIKEFITYDNKKIAFVYAPSGGSNPGSELYMLNMDTTPYEASSGQYVEDVVSQTGTTTDLGASASAIYAGDSITFTSTVTGRTPTGDVVFKNGANTLDTVALVDGIAIFTTTSLPIGDLSITAEYLGDASNFGSSDSLLVHVVDGTPILTTLPAFAMIATYEATGDANLPPVASLHAIPASTTAGQSVTLLWDTSNVAAVQITGSNGVDDFDTGVMLTSGSGAYVCGGGFASTITLTLACFDRNGVPLAATAEATITIS